MEFNIGDKVNVVVTPEQQAKLGIQNNIKNPCTIVGKYTNGVDGYFMTQNDPTTKGQLGVPAKFLEKV